MDEDRIQPDIAQQNDVPDQTHFEVFIFHGVPAVFDDQGLICKALDVRQGLQENIRLFDKFLHFLFLYSDLQERSPRLCFSAPNSELNYSELH